MELLVIDQDQQYRFPVNENETILNALRRNGLTITAPCGGQGTCLKCTVDLEGIGSVLSCQTPMNEALWMQAKVPLDQPLVIRMPDRIKPQISTMGMLPPLILSPLIAETKIKLPEPSLEDQRPDDLRLEQESGHFVSFRLLPELPYVLRQTSFFPAYYYRTDNRCVQRFVSPDNHNPLGMAVDIGTTTLASYLCDLETGRMLASDAILNPQRSFGTDVISRIEAAESGYQEDLHKVLVKAIGEMADRLLDLAGRKYTDHFRREEIAHVVLVGNTVMMHFLGNMPADAIARTPFIPVSVSAKTLTAEDLQLPLLPDTVCQLLPSVAGYVGADITAGILATGLTGNKEDKVALLLDIGTNGEIVLSVHNQLIACSAAAGPAFEAANISCGLGGVQGAIDKVWIEDDDLCFTVIGQPRNGPVKEALSKNNSNSAGRNSPVRAAGICGSGLVSAIAAFLKAGMIDETGRITDEPENLPFALAGRIVEEDGMPRIILADASQSANGSRIYLTQKDIRELQNAKAAIAAGILLLLEKSSLRPEEVDDVYIAGGFGNYLSIDDALTIGLLPVGFSGKTHSAGNTAGMGALACLLQQEYFHLASEIAKQVTYFELSAEKRFTDLYIDAMLFSEPNAKMEATVDRM